MWKNDGFCLLSKALQQIYTVSQIRESEVNLRITVQLPDGDHSGVPTEGAERESTHSERTGGMPIRIPLRLVLFSLESSRVDSSHANLPEGRVTIHLGLSMGLSISSPRP